MTVNDDGVSITVGDNSGGGGGDGVPMRRLVVMMACQCQVVVLVEDLGKEKVGNNVSDR